MMRRRRIAPFRRKAQGNPAQQTAPFGQPVTGEDGAFEGTPEAEAIETQKRVDTEAWEDANDVGGQDTSPDPAQQVAPYDGSVIASIRKDAVEVEAGASPLSNWGKVATCPDCRGEGDCSACLGEKTASICAYCGGSNICPSCEKTGFVRIAPAEAPKAAKPAKQVKATVRAPEPEMGARVILESPYNRPMVMGRIGGLDPEHGRMLVRWSDGSSSLENVADYVFDSPPEGG